jgi:hypothetical protein
MTLERGTARTGLIDFTDQPLLESIPQVVAIEGLRDV